MFNIKRPITASAVLSIILSVILLSFQTFIIPVICLLLCLIIVSACYKHFRELIVVFVLLLFIVISFGINFYTKILPAENVTDLKVEISGVITDATYIDDYIRYTAKVNNCEDNRIVNGSIYLYSYSESLPIGSRITADVKISTLKDKGRFSHYSRNVLFSGNIKRIYNLTETKNISYHIAKLRENLKSTLFSNLPYDIATTMNSMTVGDRTYEEDYFNKMVRNCGVSHVMVVSGSHMAIVCGSLYKLLKIIKMPDKFSSLITILATLVFMALCGLSPSVVRSGVMYIIMLLGVFFRKDTDPLNSLCFVVIMLLIINPFILKDVGFILSAASTAGILVLNPLILKLIRIEKWRFAPLKVLCEITVITVCAQLVTLPICLYYFGFISPYAVLVNVLISYAVTISVVSAFVGILLFAVPVLQPLSVPAFRLCSYSTSYFNNIIEYFGNL